MRKIPKGPVAAPTKGPQSGGARARVQLTLRVPEYLYRAMVSLAKDEGISVNEYAIRSLEKGVPA